MRIYIAGKITGEPIVACIKKFIRAAARISTQFIKIEERSNETVGVAPDTIIPLELEGIYFGISHEAAIKICLEALKECTHAYFLEDWTDSKGARIEYQYCLDNNIEMIFQKDINELWTKKKKE